MKSEKRAYRLAATVQWKMDSDSSLFHCGLFGPKLPKPTVRKLKRKRSKAARKLNR